MECVLLIQDAISTDKLYRIMVTYEIGPVVKIREVIDGSKLSVSASFSFSIVVFGWVLLTV